MKKKVKYIVFVTETGDVVSKHRTYNNALKALDKCNEYSGSFGRLDYDIKTIEL